jgi:hypothetical protein
MQRTVFVLFVAWITHAICANAADLSLAGEKIDWLNGGPSTCPFTVHVSSTIADPVALSGWQLRFQIVPDINTNGTVLFDSVSLNLALFEIYDLGDPNPPATPDISSLIAGITHNFEPVFIGKDSVDLLQLGLAVSADAMGQFDIAVLPSSLTPGDYYGTEWYSTDYLSKEFDGIPFGVDRVIIGSVFIVPEPATMYLLLGAMMTLAIELLIRHRKQHQRRLNEFPVC